MNPRSSRQHTECDSRRLPTMFAVLIHRPGRPCDRNGRRGER